MKFTKMQGCGNDYVYINCMEDMPKNPEELAISVSDRRFGVGSDGLILIAPSEQADFQMIMYNADGSRAEMCGNGIRCVGKYVYDKGLTDKCKLTIETLAGLKYLTLTIADDEVAEVTVDMGKPITEPKDIPVLAEGDAVIAMPIEVAGQTFAITAVSMGNPHAVVYIKDTTQLEIETLGPLFEYHKLFPKHINTEFVQIIDRSHIRMRVWERGSGETFACGTGACACAYASMLNGHVEDEVSVEMLGGTLSIRYDRKHEHILMTGPAVTVFEGVINL